MDLDLRGIHVPLITPFSGDGATVDLDALERLAHRVADNGAAGLVALGTTAEAASLDAGERAAIVTTCRRVARERGVVLSVGVGTNDTRKAAAELAALGQVGSGAREAALVTVPYFTRPSEDGVVAHFAALAAASPVPLIVYHVPYRTSRPLSAATLRRLAALPGVAGIKHAVGVLDGDTMDLLSDPPEGFAVLAGDDVLLGPLLALGAAGGILASAHVATRAFVDVVDAWQSGDVPRARALGSGLVRLSARLFAEPNPAVVKGVLRARGEIRSAAVRLPLLAAREGAVTAAVEALGDVESQRTALAAV
ncbi:dihydrodipicolinate synthase family protein [Uniformispora flossi]|uniref:dihydrodipicolinate synthase family protein n=1 Tax=Uniformispora flossi TaxID=3390723 RepID=UPI003C304EF4